MQSSQPGEVSFGPKFTDSPWLSKEMLIITSKHESPELTSKSAWLAAKTVTLYTVPFDLLIPETRNLVVTTDKLAIRIIALR